MDVIVFALLTVFVMVFCVCCFMGLLAFVMVLIVSNCCVGVLVLLIMLFLRFFFVFNGFIFVVRFETFGCFIEFHFGCNIFMVLIMRGWMLTVLFYVVLMCIYVSIVSNTFVLFALCGFQ